MGHTAQLTCSVCPLWSVRGGKWSLTSRLASSPSTLGHAILLTLRCCCAVLCVQNRVVGDHLRDFIEDLLLEYKVDITVSGGCGMECKGMGAKAGLDERWAAMVGKGGVGSARRRARRKNVMRCAHNACVLCCC